MNKIKKERKISVSYTIKSNFNNIEKMNEAKLITEEEYKQLLQIHQNLTIRWLSMGIII